MRKVVFSSSITEPESLSSSNIEILSSKLKSTSIRNTNLELQSCERASIFKTTI